MTKIIKSKPILLGFIVLFVSGAIYLLLEGKKGVTQEKTKESNFYINQKLGISFKYPKLWDSPEVFEKGVCFPQGCILINKIEEYFQEKAIFFSEEKIKEMISFVQELRTKNVAHNKYSHCYGKFPCEPLNNFQLDCFGVGGYISLRTLFNTSHNINFLRTIGYCGFDVDLFNFYYYAILIDKNKIVEAKFTLFPPESPSYNWAIGIAKEDYSNWEEFENILREALWNDRLPLDLQKQIQDYDLIFSSIKIE